jgi:hypothetical protein
VRQEHPLELHNHSGECSAATSTKPTAAALAWSPRRLRTRYPQSAVNTYGGSAAGATHRSRHCHSLPVPTRLPNPHQDEG